MSRVKSISSYSNLEDPYANYNKPSTSLKSLRVPLKKGISKTASKPQNRVFLTQDDDTYHNFEETTMHTRKSNYEDSTNKGRLCVSDKKVRSILGRLDSTINKLNDAFKSCENNLSKTSASFFSRTTRNAGNTFLTDPNLETGSSLLSKKAPKLQEFSHMSITEFFTPRINEKINKVVQQLDLDPMSSKIGDHLWSQVNNGMDYFNLLRYEIREKSEHLRLLRQKEETCDILADNTQLEDDIRNLQESIEKAMNEVEMAEMQTDVLHDMIYQRKTDKVLQLKRFQQSIQPYMKATHKLDKDVDHIMSINQILQNYMSEMGEIQSISISNKKFMDKLRNARELTETKAARFDNNLELEEVYGKKKKQFIIKTKKDIDVTKSKEKAKVEAAEKRELNDLHKTKQDFENKFDLLSTVSKQYRDKEEYVAHLDSLKQNNDELYTRVRELDEDINLKRTIDLPTLHAEITELKTNKDPHNGFTEVTQLRKEYTEKEKRNEDAERTMVAKEKLTTDLIRGVMTIFGKVSMVKDYLNLSKLDEIKIKQDNLGDILMFSGEVLEILTKNNTDNIQVRSQPISLQDVSDDEQ